MTGYYEDGEKYYKWKEDGFKDCTREDLLWCIEFMEEEAFQASCEAMGEDN